MHQAHDREPTRQTSSTPPAEPEPSSSASNWPVVIAVAKAVTVVARAVITILFFFRMIDR